MKVAGCFYSQQNIQFNIFRLEKWSLHTMYGNSCIPCEVVLIFTKPICNYKDGV